MKAALALLVIVGFTVPTVVTLHIKHLGEAGAEAQTHLQQMVTETRIQDGIEWRVVAGRMLAHTAQEDLVAARQRADEHMEDAHELGLSPRAMEAIMEVTQTYSDAVDEELRLISLSQLQRARDFDEAVVDPAFEVVVRRLEAETQELESDAVSLQHHGDVGMLLTVLFSLVLVSVVQGRRRHTEVRSQVRRQSEARYRTLIDQSSDLVLVVDRAGKTTFASPSAVRMIRSGDSGVVDFVNTVDPLDRTRLLLALETAVPGSKLIEEFRLNGRHGSATFELTVQDLTDDDSVDGLVLTGHDVTDRLTMHREMEHLAQHDHLTGLPNRALLFDRFERALLGAERDGTRVGLLLLDLERFKEVNDTFGHPYGDELLRQIGPRLSSALRGVDTLARVGGDEFAVLLVDVRDVAAASKVASGLLAALTAPFHVEDVALDVEASIGVAISGEHGEDVFSLMQHADIAMYVAKTQHLGVSAYDPVADDHSASKLAMVGDLRRALERNELILHYQPKVNIRTGDLVGAEALVRWEHPVNGLVLPDEFIPIAERTGLINPLTSHVMHVALAQARTWIDAGRPLPIAVNMSARNLHDEHFAELVAELLAQYDVPAGLFELEVTESAIMIDAARARQTLTELSALGIRLSIDDFGAGYTSLSQLTNMPISEIKIDRSFVMRMTMDANDALIVQSIISLAHNLGITLVAEGVENSTVLAALSVFGCDIAQGFHINGPMPVDSFDLWSMTMTTPMMMLDDHKHLTR
jgi:diguanylate cyclase (GGDEF)-like protein/PAS domain S-box-containing protein